MAESIGETHLLRALSRLSILEEEIEDCLPARKRELKRLKRRASRRRSSCNNSINVCSSLDTSLEAPQPRSSCGQPLSPIRHESSQVGDDQNDSSVVGSSFEAAEEEEEEVVVEDDAAYEEEAEDEETRRLTEEIRMLEEETARLALEAYDEDDEVDDDEEAEEDFAEDDARAEPPTDEEAAEEEEEEEVVGDGYDQANEDSGEEGTEDEDTTEAGEEDDPTFRGVLAAMAQLELAEQEEGESADEAEAVEVDKDQKSIEQSSVIDDVDDAQEVSEVGVPAHHVEAEDSRCDESSISTSSEADDADEKASSADDEEADAALDDTANDASETQYEEEEQRTTKKKGKKESEERKRSEEQSRRQRRSSEETQQPEEEEDEDDDKPVVRKRLRKLAEVKAARESKKNKPVPIFSDDDSDGEEEGQMEEEPARPDKKKKKERDGMRNKLRVLARQTVSEAVEDEPTSGSESEGAEEGEDEHHPTDVEPTYDGGDEEAESDNDDGRCATPAAKPKTLRTADDDDGDGEKERESARQKAKHSVPVKEEDAEAENEQEEENDEDEEEDAPSWRRLRKFVEPKGEPRGADKQQSTTDRKKKAIESKGKDGTKQEMTKKSKDADEEFVEEDIERVQLWKGLSIPAKIWDGLYLYQKACVRGVEFMWSLYTKKTGGILGDEMGLGKTIQALVLVLGALTSGRAKRVLIVMPLSVMKNWENELMKWSDNGAMLESRGMGICIMHGAMNKKKNESRDQVFHHEGGICFTTYGNIPTKLNSFVSINWDMVLLDEGHKIKNHRIALSQAMRKIPSTTRILLTGTPIQNNLMELWSLFDYTCKGQLLGTIHQFGRQFEQPIKYATYKCASAEEKQLSHELSKQLRHILAPHFLRREKKDVFNTNGTTPKANAAKQEGDQLASPSSSEERQQQALTTRMNDFIIWLSLSQVQEKLYRSFLASDQVKNVLATTKNVLEGLVLLKKLCDHPRLLTAKNSEAVDADLLATCGFKDWLHSKENDADEESGAIAKPKKTDRNARVTSDDEEDSAESESESDNEEEVEHVPVTRQAAKRKQATQTTETRRPSHKTLSADEFNTRLPHEVKLRIFGFVCGLVDVEAISKLMLVCSHWKQVASDDALWFPLCRHQSFVDARGRDLQALSLANAQRREDRRARQEVAEARRMAYTIHPTADNAEACMLEEDSSDADESEDLDDQVTEDAVPLPLGTAKSWRECFLRKRRDNLLQISAKLVFLMRLLPKLQEEGSRVLIFSQSRKMLNIIELLLKESDHTFLRIDGSISKSDERQRRVELFNSDPSYFCFLLTTVVGGIGLNLTGADRVVIVDPSWNPTHDNQAVCRAFRLGQKKNVIVYRLITCGTIEEKIYRRQVFKGAIVQSTMTQKSSLRYFSREELADLFHLGDPRVAQTQKDLHALHAHERVTDEYTDQHIQYLHEIGGVHGISDHDLLFSKTQAVESSAVAKQQAKDAARHLQNNNSDGEDDDDVADGRKRRTNSEQKGNNIDQAEGDDNAEEFASTRTRTDNGAARKNNNELAKDRRREQRSAEAALGGAPAVTPSRRRPRESIADTALNAFTPPVTIYSRVIERTRTRKLASPASPLTPMRNKGAKLYGPVL